MTTKPLMEARRAVLRAGQGRGVPARHRARLMQIAMELLDMEREYDDKPRRPLTHVEATAREEA